MADKNSWLKGVRQRILGSLKKAGVNAGNLASKDTAAVARDVFIGLKKEFEAHPVTNAEEGAEFFFVILKQTPDWVRQALALFFMEEMANLLERKGVVRGPDTIRNVARVAFEAEQSRMALGGSPSVMTDDQIDTYLKPGVMTALSAAKTWPAGLTGSATGIYNKLTGAVSPPPGGPMPSKNPAPVGATIPGVTPTGATPPPPAPAPTPTPAPGPAAGGGHPPPSSPPPGGHGGGGGSHPPPHDPHGSHDAQPLSPDQNRALLLYIRILGFRAEGKEWVNEPDRLQETTWCARWALRNPHDPKVVAAFRTLPSITEEEDQIADGYMDTLRNVHDPVRTALLDPVNKAARDHLLEVVRRFGNFQNLVRHVAEPPPWLGWWFWIRDSLDDHFTVDQRAQVLGAFDSVQGWVLGTGSAPPPNETWSQWTGRKLNGLGILFRAAVVLLPVIILAVLAFDNIELDSVMKWIPGTKKHEDGAHHDPAKPGEAGKDHGPAHGKKPLRKGVLTKLLGAVLWLSIMLVAVPVVCVTLLMALWAVVSMFSPEMTPQAFWFQAAIMCFWGACLIGVLPDQVTSWAFPADLEAKAQTLKEPHVSGNTEAHKTLEEKNVKRGLHLDGFMRPIMVKGTLGATLLGALMNMSWLPWRHYESLPAGLFFAALYWLILAAYYGQQFGALIALTDQKKLIRLGGNALLAGFVISLLGSALAFIVFKQGDDVMAVQTMQGVGPVIFSDKHEEAPVIQSSRSSTLDCSARDRLEAKSPGYCSVRFPTNARCQCH